MRAHFHQVLKRPKKFPLYDPIIVNVLQLLLLDSGLRNALKVHFEIYPQVLTHMSYASEDNGYF